ncbi:MAG: mechanosensitive ion channel [bacterium]|nr:mechanosensitive ion channel [bacterium]
MAFALIGVVALLLFGATRLPRLKVLRSLRAGFGMVAVSSLGVWGLELAGEPTPWTKWAGLVCALSIAYLAARAALLVLFDWLLVQRFGVPIPRLARDVIALFAYLVIGAIVLQEAGIKVGPLLATSAVLTVIIGLALQETLGTLLAGLTLAWEQRLTTGSWVELDEVMGKIEELGWRSLVLRTRLGERIVIPNSTVARSRLRLFGDGSEPVAVPVRLGVAYGVAPDRVKDILTSVCADLPHVLERPAPLILTAQFADSAVVYECRPWTRTPWLAPEIHDTILTRSHAALRRAEMEIPFPQRTLHLATPRADDRPTQSIEALARCELFSDLAPDALNDLSERSSWLRFAPGEAIVTEGDASTALFVLADGTAEVVHGEDTVGTLSSGDVFGEIAFLTNTPRTATVRAQQATAVVKVDSTALAALLETREELAAELAERMAERRAQLEKTGRGRAEPQRAGLVDALRYHLGRLVHSEPGTK